MNNRASTVPTKQGRRRRGRQTYRIAVCTSNVVLLLSKSIRVYPCWLMAAARARLCSAATWRAALRASAADELEAGSRAELRESLSLARPGSADMSAEPGCRTIGPRDPMSDAGAPRLPADAVGEVPRREPATTAFEPRWGRVARACEPAIAVKACAGGCPTVLSGCPLRLLAVSVRQRRGTTAPAGKYEAAVGAARRLVGSSAGLACKPALHARIHAGLPIAYYLIYGKYFVATAIRLRRDVPLAIATDWPCHP